ncbi:MAG: transglycosylase SLT domain-containing protein [Xenococcaceae cyanobacterium MO_207.B15]|nr:transglycosylase SLT domain-containing protein [Xenococcaceae cyanobacterium MO_207.B15]
MQKLLNTKTSLALSIGFLSSLTLTSCSYLIKSSTEKDTTEWFPPQQIFATAPAVLAVDRSETENRAILVSASNLIQQNQGQQALEQLENLEQTYPLLAPYILFKKGQAYQLAKENPKAEATWKQLITKYPDSPAVAEALYLLGKTNPTYWEQAIEQFPHHPRTHQLMWDSLKKNPNQPRLMNLLVKYAPDDQGVDQIRDRLVSEYSNVLTPDNWEAIGDSYWKKWDYGKAGEAYAKAPRTPRNLYRAGRGYHLAKSKQTAKQFYLQLLQQYPNAEETGLGLRRLATIVNKRQALTYLNRVIANFPQQADEALLEKAGILKALNSPVYASQTKEILLTQYKDSDAAAQYRWSMARKEAKKGNLVKAWQWAQPIVVNNPNNSLAPKASFWIGKWAEKLGREEDATKAFQATLGGFPHSYYAWRSAVALGWDVGDFTNVRDIQPQVISKTNFIPPAGSQVFKELYQLGLKAEAWGQFQVEIANKEQLTVNEQFTYGLMKLYRGQNLRGINKIWHLERRTSPEDRQQWQALRQTPEYWQSLFPIPYEDSIFKWSEYRQLNPLLVTSLIRQESRFEKEIRSSAGALGLMQVMPATGKTAAKNIGLANYSLTNPEDNINIGTYYLDYTHNRYNNNSMLAIASYNAGPNNVAKWISRYGLNDFDEFVEQIPFRETKGYVESVFENYWNYMRIYNPEIAQMFEQITAAQ